MLTTVQRALLSVSDKQGIVPFAQGLAARGVEIVSTGGTAQALQAAGVAVMEVSAFTGSPEVMEGRVKTLHPRVHGGILMRDTEADRQDLQNLGGAPIDLVCINLYPFAATVAGGGTFAAAIENIDIGGPAMLRSAAKNHQRVLAVCDPADYDEVLAALDAGVSNALRRRLASKVFAHTAAYDGAIAAYLTQQSESGSVGEANSNLPERWQATYRKAYGLRYGENPHQQAAFYVEQSPAAGTLAAATSLDGNGKELSFNNLVDVDAALEAVREFDQPAAVIVKHSNPCGVAQQASIEQAFRLARGADETSAFGGIVALNREIDAATATALAETFLECIAAPSFSTAALTTLRSKKGLRLLALGSLPAAEQPGWSSKPVSGGLLVQQRDATAAGEVRLAQLVTHRGPTAAELQALDFAWKVCKHVKSNAIVLAAEGRTVGVGAGQMSRLVSVQIAVQKAGAQARGSVLASDAFFPFADGLETAIEAGVTAVVQPGGSKRDAEVLAAAEKAGIAMLFTGVRHFRH